MSTIIETIIITPNKEMPLDVFKYCHRFSSYAEIMERTEDGKIIWNENATLLYSEDIAEAEWTGIQNDFFNVSLEIPKEYIDEIAL